MSAVETLKQGWAENLEEYPAVNLAVGGTKMAAAVALAILARIRFGNPALAVGTALSFAELPDLIWGEQEDDSIFHHMGTSFAGRNGLRSLQKGIQYATIGLLGHKIFQGLRVRDFSTPALLRLGAYAGGAVVAAAPALSTAYPVIRDWKDAVIPDSKGEEYIQQFLLCAGLTYDPIPWQTSK